MKVEDTNAFIPARVALTVVEGGQSAADDIEQRLIAVLSLRPEGSKGKERGKALERASLGFAFFSSHCYLPGTLFKTTVSPSLLVKRMVPSF